MGRSRVLALAVAAALVTGGVALALLDGDLSGAPWPGDDPNGSGAGGGPDPAAVSPPPGLSLPPAAPARPVLGLPAGPLPDAGALRSRLAPLLADPDLGPHSGVVVRDLARDRPLLTLGDPDPYVPASTLKLFTATAVLAELGPDHRFTTSVRLAGRGDGGSARSPLAVLVGGGDPLLAARPPGPGEAVVPTTVSVSGLAADTARALRSEGVRRVRVGYDDSLFSGPAVAASWEPDYVPGDVISPVSALWVDEGRVDPDAVERSPDPARAAGQAFADALRRRGVRVLGGAVPAAAPPASSLLAEGSGAELERVVEHVLAVSDNEAAEVLLRHVALGTGRPGSFAGGVAAVREVLTGLGVPFAGVRTYDGSGLSRANRVTRDALAQVLQLGADPERLELRAVVAGLPVAHFTGSLQYRFTAPTARAARGVVRAKTGTLSRVHGLAGSVVTRDGALLGFALLTDRVALADTLDARQLLDEMAAALAGCGCRP